MSKNKRTARYDRSEQRASPVNGKKVRYAVVGLGYISQVAVLPAFQHTRENSELVALVSGDATKGTELPKKYKVDKTQQLRTVSRMPGKRRD
jgi:predicted dehydrogenase